MMITFQIKTRIMFFSMLYGMMVTVPAVADDIEIYTTATTSTATMQPNVLFLLDTSGSMDNPINTRPPYDPSVDYRADYPSASCYNKNRVYTSDIWPLSASFGSPNTVTIAEDFCVKYSGYFTSYIQEVNQSAVKCSPASTAFASTGSYTGRVSQYRGSSWRNNIKKGGSKLNKYVECEADSGTHGIDSSGSKVWAANNVEWSSDADDSIDWSKKGESVTLYSGNYLSYLIGVSLTTVITRMEAMQDALGGLVAAASGINIGLMRFSSNGDGGAVVVPMDDIGTNRADFLAALGDSTTAGVMDVGGSTPLSEAYYEAAMYYQGKNVDYGLASTRRISGSDVSYVSVAGSRIGGASGTKYKSPIAGECQKNLLILLTDGVPESDVLDSSRKSNVGIGGSCGDAANNCLDEIAAEIYKEIDGVSGGIITHTIGFDVDLPLLVDTAKAGGGTSHDPDSKDALISVFSELFAKALDEDASFASPSVSVNAFNRSVHINDLFFTSFAPENTDHWAGNFKKYKLDFEDVAIDTNGDGINDSTEKQPFIADAATPPIHAIDKTTGFFNDGAISYWSSGIDGEVVEEGGAASKLDVPRKVFTFSGSYSPSTTGVFKPAGIAGVLTATVNKVGKDNIDGGTGTGVSEADLGLVPGDLIKVAGVDTPRIEVLLEWARGVDVFDDNGDGSYVDARYEMGDPLHSQPALVQYGETSGEPNVIAYVATNDGYLHGIDTKTGVEKFAFIPQELLPNLNKLMENDFGVTYGLDGDVVAWVNDQDKNGEIDGSDHVYLYVGMRRGGKNIYSVDVTVPESPELRWVIKGGIGDYADLGETWSTVNVEKIKDGTGERTVLIFGGGYDTDQDTVSVRTPDDVGNKVYIADAKTGELLWSAGSSGDTVITEMVYSIPARIKPLDMKGDGLIDRLYVSDMGGQIFRFDLKNDGSALSSAISGGRVADFAGTAAADARRFYYPPDVALISERGKQAYLALGITSSYRAHPLDEVIHDRIYLLRDYDIYSKPSVYTTYDEADLYNATLNLVAEGSDAEKDAARAALDAAGNKGWFINLDDQTSAANWLGEKGLSEAIFLEGTLIVSTFIPTDPAAITDSCVTEAGNGRVYYLDTLDASAAIPDDSDSRTSRYTPLAKTGIPPSPNVIITKEGVPTLCVGTECEAAQVAKGVRKTYWYEVEK